MTASPERSALGFSDQVMEGVSLSPVLGGDTWKSMAPMKPVAAVPEATQAKQLNAGLSVAALNKDYFGSSHSAQAFENVFGHNRV